MSDLIQQDGNHSFSNNDNTQKEEDDDEHKQIQVVLGNRPNNLGWSNDGYLPENWTVRPSNNNITIHRDNRRILASKLPTVFVSNHRSFFPKFRNFLEAMQTLGLTLGLHSEIWEDKENKTHQNLIEEAFELEGVTWISNTRPDRRGGGAAISLLNEDFTITKLDVIIPKNLEVVWGLVRPKRPTTDFKGIVVCSFYSVPYSKKKVQLVQHLAINYSELKSKYKNCFFLFGGDKNDLQINNILEIAPTLHMHNTKPTHERKNIDVLVSDMIHLYRESTVIPNVLTDIPDGQPGGGKQSDHSIVYCEPSNWLSRGQGE